MPKSPPRARATLAKTRFATSLGWAIAGRAEQRKLKAGALAAAALTDAQVKLPILHSAVPLAEVLEYRQKNPDALAKVRETLGLMARRIEAEPWSADFANEIETKTVPELIGQLTDVAKARDAWLGPACLPTASSNAACPSPTSSSSRRSRPA